MSKIYTQDELVQEPYEVYARLREQAPILAIQSQSEGKTYFVTRYEDVAAILKDPNYSTDSSTAPGARNYRDVWWIPQILRAFISNMLLVDDPDHARLRHLVHKAFTPRMIKQLDAKIVSLANALLDEAAQSDTVDLISAFALPIPLTIISEMMGVPERDRLKFHKWTTNFLADSTGARLEIASRILDGWGMQRFFKRLIKLRTDQPSDDLTSALIRAEQDGDKLTENELIANLFLLLLAGHETTVNLIGNGILALLEHPEQLDLLKRQPDLMDGAVEELLRYTNPVIQIAPRYVKEPTELGGIHLPAGTTMVLSIASANRDDSFFEGADKLNIQRQPNKHLSFGVGIHYCLGAPLARLEAKRALEILFGRFPNLKLADSAETLEWRKSPAVRGLKALPVHLQP